MSMPTARELYVELCQEPLARLDAPRAHEVCLGEVAAALETTPAALRARTRVPAADERRQVAMWLLRQRQLSSVAIGRLLGRDHSTVLHGCAVIEARRQVDASFAARLAGLSREVR